MVSRVVRDVDGASPSCRQAVERIEERDLLPAGSLPARSLPAAPKGQPAPGDPLDPAGLEAPRLGGSVDLRGPGCPAGLAGCP